MHKKLWLYRGLSVLIVLCLILGTGAFVFYKRIPSVANQLASQDETTVLIISPDGSASYPADASIPITAMATSSQPMTTMELWVDGSLFATQSPGTDENASLFYKNWHWMPLVPGEHMLVVRAINLDGSVGTSNLVRIKVDKAAGFVLRHTTQPGDTWESLTQSCGTSVETIAGQNPGFDPAAPLPVGEQVQIPCGSTLPRMASTGPGITPPLTEQPASSPSSPPTNVGFWLNSLLSPTSALPSAPSLTAGLNGCTVTLMVQDNSKDEKGFEIWRSGVNGYDRIATLGPNSGASFSYKETVQQPGQIQYVVSAFNTEGKMTSNIVAVNVPDGACGDPGNPDVSYLNGILTVPMDLNVAYLYASLDGGAWQRLPSGDDFFSPNNGQVDLHQYLEPLLTTYPDARQASLKVWGWSDGALQNLGNLSVTFDHTSLTFCNWDDPAQCTGDIGSTLWVTTGEVPSNALNSTRTFHFTANTPGIPFALVQISSRPFSEAFQLEDPYLVDSYAIQTEQSSGGISGKFDVNFSFYQQQGGSDVTSNFILNHSIWPAAQPSPFDQNIIKMMNTNGVGSALLEGLPDPVYYIRVVPWDLNKPVGGLSNTVVLTYKARQEPPPFKIDTGSTPSYDLEILAYSPEQKVNPASFGCVIITAIDEAKVRASLENSIPGSSLGGLTDIVNSFVDSYKNAMANGDALCPPPLPEESTWDFVVGQLTEFWDSVIQAFNAIKNGLVDLVATGLNGLFGPDFCGKTCKAGLMTALNYSITYFTGIPPTLPSFKDLVNNGIDYTVSLAVSEAGISCDAKCAAQIRAGVQTVADAVTSAQSQSGCNAAAAHWYGKQALCLPDGLTTKPVPESTYIPGIATIQATRNGKGYQWSPDSDYSVLITSTARNEAMVGQSIWFYGPSWPATEKKYNVLLQETSPGNPAGNMTFPFTIPEPMEGSLFQPASVILPDTLDTGSKLVVPVALTSTAYSVAGEGYIYPPLMVYALGQAKTMGMPDSYFDSLFGALQSNSNYYLSRPGYSITIEAVLLCYDKVALKKIPCSNPVTRTFSAEEVQTLIDNLNEVQP
jgi:hypothetical protein